jgi:hypothetical protein
VGARVALEEIASVEAHALDEVDGKTLVVDAHATEQARDHAEDLVVEHELFGGVDLGSVEQPASEDEVGAGEELGEHRQRVLPAGLGVGLLGLGAAVAQAGGQPVEGRHLALQDAQQDRLGDGGEVGAGAHVERRGPAGVDDARARTGQLYGCHGGDDLGVVDDRRSGRRDRRRGAEDGHGVEHEGDAGLGEGERQVHAAVLLVQRRHRAEDAGEERSFAQLAAAAGDRLGHADQPASLVLVFDGDDDRVLARAPQARVELVEDARALRAVLGRHDRRRDRDVVEAVREARGVAHVVFDRRAHRAVRLAHCDGAPVDGEVRVLAVQRQVVLGLAGAERERPRNGGDGARDELGRQLRDGRSPVDRRAVLLEHVERALRMKGATRGGEHVQGGLVDAAHVGVTDDLERSRPPADVVGLGVRHGAPPSAGRVLLPGPAAASVLSNQSSVNALTTKGEVTARTRAS